jgi:hypothetical protein
MSPYRQIPSLDAVVLVAHDALRIDVWTRGPQGWVLASFAEGEVISLDAIGCTLPVNDVYAALRDA